MAGCNDNCNCHISGADGVATDGLGDAETPYVIGVDDDRTIPRRGTHAERLVLDTSGLSAGERFFELDTGQEFVWLGSGWDAVTTAWVESSELSTTLTAGVGVQQDVASAELTAGYWFVYASGNIEASVDAAPPIVWTARLHDTTNDIAINETHTSGLFEDAGDPTHSFARPFGLGRMYHVAATATVKLQIARDGTHGTHLIINPSLVAIRIPGV